MLNNTNHYKIFTKSDNDKVRDEVRKINWNVALNDHNSIDILDFILDNFKAVYDKCNYNVKIKLNKRETCKWLSERIVHMCKTRENFFIYS